MNCHKQEQPSGAEDSNFYLEELEAMEKDES